MVWVSKCCCCSLRGGAIAIGVVFLVLNGLGAISAAVNIGLTHQFRQYIGDILMNISITSLVFYVISAIVSCLLFVPGCMEDGKAKKHKWCLIPFIVWSIICILGLIGLAVYLIVEVGIGILLFSVAVYFVFIIVDIYCIIMIVSYYQHLRDFDPSAVPQANQNVVYVPQQPMAYAGQQPVGYAAPPPAGYVQQPGYAQPPVGYAQPPVYAQQPAVVNTGYQKEAPPPAYAPAPEPK